MSVLVSKSMFRQEPANTIGRGVKRPAASLGETRTIPRYGALLTEYYGKMDQLPKEAEPDVPPQGLHQYRLWMHFHVFVTVDMRGKFVVKHSERGRQMTFPFTSEDDITEEWKKANHLVRQWIKDPPVHTEAAMASAAAAGLPGAPKPRPQRPPRPQDPAASASPPVPAGPLALPDMPAGGDVEVDTSRVDSDSDWTTRSSASSFDSTDSRYYYERFGPLRRGTPLDVGDGGNEGVSSAGSDLDC